MRSGVEWSGVERVLASVFKLRTDRVFLDICFRSLLGFAVRIALLQRNSHVSAYRHHNYHPIISTYFQSLLRVVASAVQSLVLHGVPALRDSTAVFPCCSSFTLSPSVDRKDVIGAAGLGVTCAPAFSVGPAFSFLHTEFGCFCIYLARFEVFYFSGVLVVSVSSGHHVIFTSRWSNRPQRNQ